MLPNWFLAFPVHGHWITALPPVPPRFRRFAADDVHLTLIFLGSCGEAAALRALESLREELRHRPRAPVTCTLKGVTPMGPKTTYSALSAHLGEGRELVTTLMQQLRDAPADAAGVTRDSRAPIPHVTLARPQRRATDADREAGLAWARNLSLPEDRWTLDRIGLYTWHQERATSLFRIVDRVFLDGS